MDTQYEKKGYLLEDFRLFHLRGAQGVKAEYHYHDFCKLLLLVSGSGGYSVDGQRYSLEAGDIVLVGSRCVHRPEFEPDSPYERIIVYISPSFLEKASTPDWDLLECFSGARGHVLRPGNPQKLLSLALDLEQDLADDRPGRVILSTGTLLRLLVKIGRETRRSGALSPAPIEPSDSRIAQILQYIDGHAAEELTIDHLAERFYLSKYHMMRLFRRETGLSINNYICRRRLLLARDLIAGGMDATEACFQAGFGSYSTFTRAYARQFGTTPTGRQIAAHRLDATYE